MAKKMYEPKARILLSEDEYGRVVIDEVVNGVHMSETIIQKSKLHEVINGKTWDYSSHKEVPSVRADARIHSDYNFAMLNIYLEIPEKNLEAHAA